MLKWRSGIVCLTMLIALCASTSARFRRPDLKKIPVADLVANLEKQLADEPKNKELLMNLGRAYAMAYATRGADVEIEKSNEDAVWFGYTPINVPFADRSTGEQHSEESKKQAQKNLDSAIKVFKQVLQLDSDNLVARLSLAWCMDQAQEEEAKELYRNVIERAWEKEKDLQTAGLGWHSITAEAIGYLKTKLDADRDAREIEELDAKVEKLSKVMRPITPIAVDLRELSGAARALDLGTRLDQMLTRDQRVRFDLDASGQPRQCSWISTESAWLVFDQRQDGVIDSGLQLFGNSTFLCQWQNGFHALRSLDANQDNQIQGAEMEHLALWQDRNSNGVSDPGEVRPLREFDIVSLSCEYKVAAENLAGDLAAFNTVGMTLGDGRQCGTYDLVLQSEWAGPSK